ncbi:MAG: glycosyltransferase family 39 protein [Kiritimatiellae bacterium]|nr:glycosyltransferase family 39 protein [Kiritimatiellia bacterium]
MDVSRERIKTVLIWLVILGSAVFFRSAGLYRGLKTGSIYHPDSPKQVYSFHNYMNGRYIWYDGSLFIDGYPLFLNHFDEWLSRPLFWGYERVAGHVFGERENPRASGNPSDDYYPNAIWLFYWTRTLRLLYGLLIVWAAYRLARFAGIGRSWAQGAALLTALNPLEVVVSHAGTGDVGVALFGATLYLLLFRHIRTGRSAWWAGAAVLGGFAFASKYQGLLISLVPALFLLLYEGACRRRLWRMIRQGLLYLFFLVVGVLAATPQFFIKGKKTLELMLANFTFLANYKTPADILDKPLLERAVLGYEKNFIPLWSAIGLVVSVAALAGVLLALRQWWMSRKAEDARVSRAASLRLALFSAPFLWVLISLFGKYNVQPFHFSYLNVPLILSAVFLLDAGWSRGGRWLRGVVLCGAILVFAAPLPSMFREHALWIREESYETQKKLSTHLMDSRYAGDEDVHRVRLFNMEDGTSLPVFRNRIRELVLPNAGFWNALHIAPVPTVPFPDPVYWIFNNGPIYPRNDREFLAAKNDRTEKAVIWSAPPERIVLGVRSGVWPTRVVLHAGGEAHRVELPPNTQTTVPISVHDLCVLITNSVEQPDAWMTRLCVDTEVGPAWITVMQNEREEALFRLFGGQAETCPEFLEEDIRRADEIADHVRRTRYYDNLGRSPAFLRAGESLPMLSFEPLAAGVYVWRAQILAESNAVAVLRGSTLFSGNNWSNSAWTVEFPLHPGLNELEHVFSKTFLPYQVHLALTCSEGACQIGVWSLKPETGGILHDLRLWREGGIRPDWARVAPKDVGRAANGPFEESMTFDNALRLRSWSIPEQSGGQGFLTVSVSMELLKPLRHLHERVVFIHFMREGERGNAGVIGFPVYQALNSETWALPIRCPMDARLEGEYEAWMGITSCRLDDRLPVQSPLVSEHPVNHRKVYIGKVVFGP